MATTFFFYGTLMVPAIVQRVTKTDGAHLEICPAVLMDHTRHQVKKMDYPGMLPILKSSILIGRKMNSDESSVRGVLIKGFTKSDVKYLHKFKGMAYELQNVQVHPLGAFSPLASSSIQDLLSKESPFPLELPALVHAKTYIWRAPISRLSPEPWSFDTFLTEKLHRWVGGYPEGVEADRALEHHVQEHRETNHTLSGDNGRFAGVIGTAEEMAQLIQDMDASSLPAIPATIEKFPEYGHDMLRYFHFDPTYINLNHGSYGSTPKPVLIACEEWGRKVEAYPDRFMRRAYLPMINTARKQVATIINTDVNECVLVTNASHAIETVLFNMEFRKGDILIGFNTTYYSVNRQLQFYADRAPYPTVSTINLVPPLSHVAILDQFRAHLRDLPRIPGSKQKIIAIIDGIISNPGVLMPWEEMVAICKSEGVISLVDAAHCIGQVPINLELAQPDFWVANCHKWLLSKRGSAVLYVPKRNQHLIKSSFPTSAVYLSPSDPKYPPEFVDLFEWTGTTDFIPLISITWAINFRQYIGREKRIMDYCHLLALAGGRRMAEILGTEMLDQTPNGELTAAMVDVLLPIPIEERQTMAELNVILRKLQDRMLLGKRFAAPYLFNRKWWVRASAQIWLEMSDFEEVANFLVTMCQDFRGNTVSN